MLFFSTLIAITWVGVYFFYSNTPYRSTGNPTLTITAPETIFAGEQGDFKIIIRNTTSTKLARADVSVRYPVGFTFIRSNPAPDNDSQNTWQLGSLEQNEERSITLTGILATGKDSTPQIQGTLSYRPGTINSEFEITATSNSPAIESPLSLLIEQPEEVRAGTSIALTLTVTAGEGQLAKPVLLSLVLPEGFTTGTPSSPPRNESELIWSIPPLTQGASWKLTTTVTPTGTTPTSTLTTQATIGFSTYMRGKETITPLVVETENTTIVGNIPTLTIASPGASLPVRVQPGSTLPLTITLTNPSAEPAQNISVSLPVNMSVWTIAPGQSISWNPVTTPELARLEPGQSTTLTTSLIAKSTIPPRGTFQATATITTLGEDTGIAPVRSSPLEYSSVVNVSLTGQIISTGAGTNDLIVMINNPSNTLTGAQVVIPLAPSISATTPKTQTGSVNATEMSILWTIPTLPPTPSPTTLSVELKGSTSPLTGTITLTGTESTTGAQVQNTIPPLSP